MNTENEMNRNHLGDGDAVRRMAGILSSFSVSARQLTHAMRHFIFPKDKRFQSSSETLVTITDESNAYPFNQKHQQASDVPSLKASCRREFTGSDTDQLLSELSAKTQTDKTFQVTDAMMDAIRVLELEGAINHGCIEFTAFKRAYKKQALRTHPDKNPGHEEAFYVIQQAYETIKSALCQAGAPNGSFFQAEFEWIEALKIGLKHFDKKMDEVDELVANTRHKVSIINDTDENVQALIQRVEVSLATLQESKSKPKVLGSAFYSKPISSAMILAKEGFSQFGHNGLLTDDEKVNEGCVASKNNETDSWGDAWKG